MDVSVSAVTGASGARWDPPGLSAAEAREQLARGGPNALPAPHPTPWWRRWLRQFQNPLIYILLVALGIDATAWVVEGAAGVPVESLVIAAILLLNATLGVWQEQKAEAAIGGLAALTVPQTWTRRDGAWRLVPSHELTHGDRIRLEPGDRIPADGTLGLGALVIDESILTGESVPIEKTGGDGLLSGTLVVQGTGQALVTRTGPGSTLGQLASLLGTVQPEPTPLERRLGVFARQVAGWVLVLAAVVTIAGVAADGVRHLDRALLFGVALAVAAVPEGLPAILTLTLALGVERMARRRAVVRRLSAVEALGSVTVIATDKTGTLTTGGVHVRAVESADEARALRAMVLANDADAGAGDPVDVALLTYAASRGIDPRIVRANHPRLSARAFDAAHRFMRATVAEGGRPVSYVKGAPEVLLAASRLAPEGRGTWAHAAHAQAEQGYRVLGLAAADGERDDDLEFLGLVLCWDPPREAAAEAIAAARGAGIRVVMLTGDHPATALAVARAVGLDVDRAVTGDELDRLSPEAWAQAAAAIQVFARVRPEHKLQLVEALQARGDVVAMTGDGVNDAPALKRADVGIAMGRRGSDVSREVADIVLLDDNFETIVAAIEGGRSTFANIRTFIRFLFATNLAEILVIAGGLAIASALGLRADDGTTLLPLTVVQILWINLVTDGLPALALALDRNPGLMARGPTPPSAPLLDTPSRRFILLAGCVKAGLALGVLGLAHWQWLGRDEARTVAFHFLCIGQLLFAFPARQTDRRPLLNRSLWATLAVGVALQVAIGSLPAVASLLGCVPVTPWHWAGVAALSLSAWALAEATARAVWSGPASATAGPASISARSAHP